MWRKSEAHPAADGRLGGKAYRGAKVAILVINCLIRCSPERDVWCLGGKRTRSHQDGNHILFGIYIPGGAQSAVPAVATGDRCNIVTFGNHSDAETPAMRVEKARDQAGDRFLCRRELIGRHGLN